MKFPIIVVLENIRSAYNVGSFFRTCDGAGATKLYLTGYTPYPPHSKIPKTALGAIDNIDWEYVPKTSDVIARLKAEGVQVLGVEVKDNAKNYLQFEYKFPTAFIFGNEVNGVAEETLKLCDDIIQIPMYGDKSSLNVAVSGGVILYHAVSMTK